MRRAVRVLLWALLSLDLWASGVTLPDISDPQFIDECVRSHNEARSSVSPPASDMLYMTWDEGLAIIARAWAQRCMFRHNPERNSHPAFPSVGENLWVGYPPSSFTVTGAVKSWVNETMYYHYDGNSCRVRKQCGHYTQVVWASTYKVGCAPQLCLKGSIFSVTSVIFVCNYAPAGNVGGMRPYDARGPACSRCTGACQDKLCRSPEQDQQNSYDGELSSISSRGNYVAVLITRPVALLFTALTAYAVHYKYPNVFCYE